MLRAIVDTVQVLVNPEEDLEKEEKPDPWLMSSQPEASMPRVEKQENRGSMKRREIPVISDSVETLATTEVETVPIVTGDVSKKVKVVEKNGEVEAKEEEEMRIEIKKEEVQAENPMEENQPKETASVDSETEKSILKLRKLSMDYIEKERKKSMELEALAANSVTPDGNDDFEFSDDDDNEPFDVPDVPLYLVFCINHFRGNHVMVMRTEILFSSVLVFCRQGLYTFTPPCRPEIVV